MQRPDGSWPAQGNLPPLASDDFTTTAFAIRALNIFMRGADAEETKQRTAQARLWLLRSQPQTTQERVFHLLGLTWAKAKRDPIERAISAMKTQQCSDRRLGAASDDA